MDSPKGPWPNISRRAAIALGALAAATPAFSAHALNLPETPPPDPLKRLDSARRLTVQVSIDGEGPYPFLVDTGASTSVISADIVSAQGLKIGGQTNLHSITGVQPARTVVVGEVGVGRRIRHGLTMTVLPADNLEAAGILGLDWLGSQGLLLDFAGQKMKVGAGLPYRDGRTVTVPIDMRQNGLSLLRGGVPGGSALVFLDTGSTTTVGNMALLELAQDHGAIISDWTDVALRSVTGQVFNGRLATLRLLRMGDIRLRNVPVVFGPVHTFRYWGIDQGPAILVGSDVMRAFDSVSLDFARNQVHFRVHDTRGA